MVAVIVPVRSLAGAVVARAAAGKAFLRAFIVLSGIVKFIILKALYSRSCLPAFVGERASL